MLVLVHRTYENADSVMNVLVTDRRRNTEPQRRTDRYCPVAKIRDQKGKTKQVIEFLKETIFKETKTKLNYCG